MLEKPITNKILNYLKTVPDSYVIKVTGGNYSAAGNPDIHFLCNGKPFYFEVKRDDGKGKLTKLQAITIDRIIKAGGTAAVVQSLDEVKKIISEVFKHEAMQ